MPVLQQRISASLGKVITRRTATHRHHSKLPDTGNSGSSIASTQRTERTIDLSSHKKRPHLCLWGLTLAAATAVLLVMIDSMQLKGRFLYFQKREQPRIPPDHAHDDARTKRKHGPTTGTNNASSPGLTATVKSIRTTSETRTEICFVTAVFGSSIDHVDKPAPLREFARENPSFRFLLYTNLDQLTAPGWETIIKRFSYKRFITHSRWPKFMAWKDAHIVDGCPVVIFADAHAVPNVPTREFQQLAALLLRPDSPGLAQELHPYVGQKYGGILGEFVRIRRKKRDLPQNIKASVDWLRAQPNFVKNCTMYRNTYLAYAPGSEMMRNASTAFWNRYSLELDSWRDQPLWCHVMQQHQPLLLNRTRPLFVMDNTNRRKGGGAHSYDSSSLNDGDVFWKQHDEGTERSNVVPI